MAIPIGAAAPAHVALDGGLLLWYRTWGRRGATPVLFVHGGPGQCVADYNDVNGRFFAPDEFFVVEVDQRGTGRSQPSVRDDFRHMQRYADISIGAMAADFERVRESLGIERWLVFGGSWGSTLGLEYALTYPSRCLGLILRGIFLNTAAEFDAVYARKSFEANPRRLAEFDTFFELAAREVARRGEPSLDPNDSERFVRVYEDLIKSGDRDAIWRFYVFENNLIEEDASKLLDPLVIREEEFAEAQSVSFFEARLFLRGTFEEPVQLLGERLKRLACTEHPVRTWVVQGSGDEVCPEIFAQQLVAELRHYGVPHTAYFFDAGHSAHSEAMSTRLKRCVDEFASGAQMASECDSNTS
ncbi:hypothetical protein AB1Y20_012156 [Prymnesium parvum]|uniref:prolyl aminopeptidase n=1 Tax=Prymnesium parvum TaxID=97485 RepID=A0AB34IQZ3_PRYPA